MQCINVIPFSVNIWDFMRRLYYHLFQTSHSKNFKWICLLQPNNEIGMWLYLRIVENNGEKIDMVASENCIALHCKEINNAETRSSISSLTSLFRFLFAQENQPSFPLHFSQLVFKSKSISRVIISHSVYPKRTLTLK